MFLFAIVSCVKKDGRSPGVTTTQHRDGRIHQKCFDSVGQYCAGGGPSLVSLHNGLPSAKKINDTILGVSEVELSGNCIHNLLELKDLDFLIVIETYNSIEVSL
jgi:hypothetical protein